jgi:rhodanese-related sulfurtransferase
LGDEVTILDKLKLLLLPRDPELELDTVALFSRMTENGDSPKVIDIRESHELEETGHLKGARHIPMNDVSRLVPHHIPDRCQDIVLYCQSGNRSYFSAKELQGLGYENVQSLQGGIQALQRDGFPIVG